MKKVWVIIKREYLTRVRTKAFLIGTIASPLLMLGLILLPAFFATRGGGERHVVIIDQSGDPQLFAAIKEKAESNPVRGEVGERERRRAGGTQFNLTHKPLAAGEHVERATEEYRKQVLNDPDKAYVILPPDVLGKQEPQYYAKNAADLSTGALREYISAAIVERRLVKAGFDRERIEEALKPVRLQTHKVTQEGVSKEDGRPLFLVGIVMLFFIYMSILFYGLFVMRGVIEEKQSRIVEVVISSIRPMQLMLGKLLGIGLVGLTQISIWAGSALALTIFGAGFTSQSGINLPDIPVSLFVYFILFFVLGYFLYATLYAMVGSMVSSEEEAQQAQIPVTIFIIVPMMLFTMVSNNPNSGLSIGLSMVPFFAPTLMMLRIAMVNPPLWQVLLSILIMIGTILGAVWLAARIYRVGILMYGKRPSLAELGRWLRYS